MVSNTLENSEKVWKSLDFSKILKKNLEKKSLGNGLYLQRSSFFFNHRSFKKVKVDMNNPDFWKFCLGPSFVLEKWYTFQVLSGKIISLEKSGKVWKSKGSNLSENMDGRSGRKHKFIQLCRFFTILIPDCCFVTFYENHVEI